jgi:hypothetical protein
VLSYATVDMCLLKMNMKANETRRIKNNIFGKRAYSSWSKIAYNF